MAAMSALPLAVILAITVNGLSVRVFRQAAHHTMIRDALDVWQNNLIELHSYQRSGFQRINTRNLQQ